MINKTKASRMHQIALAAGICLVAMSANASGSASDERLENVSAAAHVNTDTLGNLALAELDEHAARSLTAGFGKVSPENESQGLLSVTELTAEEANEIKGGTYFAALTRNQLTIAVTGALVWGTWRTLASALSSPTFQTVVTNSIDSVACKGVPLFSSVLLGQSQISAGKVDTRNLGITDVLIALTHGTIMASGSALCTGLVLPARTLIRTHRHQLETYCKVKTEHWP